MISKLKEAFDIVIIDSAPLQLVSDAQVLSQFASSVIYVVKADATPYQVAQNGLKKLRRVNAPDPRRRAEPARPREGREVLRRVQRLRSYKGYKKYGYTQDVRLDRLS